MRGHIHKRVHTMADGRTTTTWYVVVDRGRDRNGKRRQKWHGGYRTRKEAEAAQAKIVTEINSGTYVSPTGVTLEAFLVNEWLPGVRSQLKPTTWDSYNRTIELHVLPRLGSTPLQQVSPTALNALYAELLRDGRCDGNGGLSERSVSYVHRILHKALADAVDAQLISQNPVSRAKPPKAGKNGVDALRFWTPDELRTFLDYARGSRLHGIWVLASMTGMRRGELLGLRWSDVDLDEARLSVRRTLVSIAYKMHVSTPKTGRPRVIDLDPATVAGLREEHGRRKSDRDEWGDGYDDQDLVFARQDGTPLHPDRLSKAFDQDVARSGLPRIRLHDLRHTHASIALQAGVPVKVVSERLGHESPAFTLKQYAHVMPGMQATAACQVASAVFGTTEESACAPHESNVCSPTEHRGGE